MSDSINNDWIEIHKKTIQEKIAFLHEKLNNRQTELLQELDSIATETQKKLQECNEQLRKVNLFKMQTEEIFGTTNNVISKPVEDKIKQVEKEIFNETVNFVWDDNGLIIAIDRLGKFEKNAASENEQKHNSEKSKKLLSVPSHSFDSCSTNDKDIYTYSTNDKVIYTYSTNNKDMYTYSTDDNDIYTEVDYETMDARDNSSRTLSIPNNATKFNPTLSKNRRAVSVGNIFEVDNNETNATICTKLDEQLNTKEKQIIEKKRNRKIHTRDTGNRDLKLGARIQLKRLYSPISIKKFFPLDFKINENKQNLDNLNLLKPKSVTIEPKTGNIYVVEKGRHRVQVFSSELRSLFQFGEQIGQNRMCLPYGICIIKDMVYVSQVAIHCIHNYSVHGEFIHKVGNEGCGKGEFKSPAGLVSCTTNNLIYVCDSCNDRIQVLDSSLNYITIIGKGVLRKPLDININSLSELVVLDKNINSCLHIFSPVGKHLRDLINIELIPTLSNPIYFTIYSESYYILSDFNSNSLVMFNSDGQQIPHMICNIPVKEPKGIAWDKVRRVFVVTTNEESNAIRTFKH